MAPALQAAKEQLQRAQLEVRIGFSPVMLINSRLLQDKLDHELQNRPTADELVKKGILQGREQARSQFVPGVD